MSHYFINDDSLKDKEKIMHSEIEGVNLSFLSNSGVFSKDKVDYGTKLLLNNIDIDGMNGDVLDLGCGIGVIGITIKSKNNRVLVDMVDVNERGINLSKYNMKLNGVNTNIFISDVYSNINKKYDYIITNPPIRAGKKVVEGMIIGSYDYLKENGILYFVMRKDHGVKSLIKKLNVMFKVDVIERDKGFYIVKCVKIKKSKKSL